MLQEGDIIELREGHKIYADIPKHFAYENFRGDFSLTHHEVRLNKQFDYLMGKYIVYKTTTDGGGMDHDGPYPDGHHVFCVKDDNRAIKIDFYQSGCMTAMIEDIKPIGKAQLSWTING